MIEIETFPFTKSFETRMLEWMNEKQVAGYVSEVQNLEEPRRIPTTTWTFVDESQYAFFKLVWGDVLERNQVKER